MGLDSGSLIKKLNKTCLDAPAGGGRALPVAHQPERGDRALAAQARRGAEHRPEPALPRTSRSIPSRVQRDLVAAIDRFKTGNSRTPTLSTQIDHLIREAWVLASVQYQARQVRSGMVLLALLADETLGRQTRDASPELAKLPTEALWKDLLKIVAGSSEDEGPVDRGRPGCRRARVRPDRGAEQDPGARPVHDQPDREGQGGQIDPVLGRDSEIRQMVDILIRRRQNNPILTGEAGVGKTAVVEGFALRIAAGDVPPPLRNVALRTLDLGLLQAGAGVKGEFENRLKQVIAEVKASPTPIILFIDEAHTMIGAGGQAGQSDAANLLKPALARGELRTIAATTWAEYKKYFEKDAALARRFQVIKVEEPAETQAIIMMRGITGTLEHHHKVRILDEAVEASVRLSARYLSGRQLPDKSVSLLDTACARVAIGQNATPPAVEDAARRIENLKVEIGILEREKVTGARHDERLAEAVEELQKAEANLDELQKRWDAERALVEQIIGLRDQIERHHAPDKGGADGTKSQAADALAPVPDVETLKADLEARTDELRRLQGENPLMQVCVDAQTIAEVISGWTGIPVGKMMTDEIRTVLDARNRGWKSACIGQSHAPGGDQPAHPDRAGQPDRPEAADRRLPAGRPQRRGQDRDGVCAGRDPLRRRAQPDLDQHVRVSGGPHGLGPQGLAPRLRRLRRRGRADRGRPAQALQRGPARRGREGPPRRHGALLPGLRQGRPRGRRRARDRLQEHRHPADVERRHRHVHEALRRPRHDARRRRRWPRRSVPTSSRSSSPPSWAG